MIEARGLTKRYGRVLAVDGLSFDVRPGVVTGFPGPNGSGTTPQRSRRPDAPRGHLRLGTYTRPVITRAMSASH